jgi:hypothetical protein
MNTPHFVACLAISGPQFEILLRDFIASPDGRASKASASIKQKAYRGEMTLGRCSG